MQFIPMTSEEIQVSIEAVELYSAQTIKSADTCEHMEHAIRAGDGLVGRVNTYPYETWELCNRQETRIMLLSNLLRKLTTYGPNPRQT